MVKGLKGTWAEPVVKGDVDRTGGQRVKGDVGGTGG